MYCCPEVENIALGGALWVEALEDVFSQVNRKGAIVSALSGMQGTGAATLSPVTAKPFQVTQLLKNLQHADLSSNLGEIDGGRCLGRVGVRGTWPPGRIAGERTGIYLGITRGDHFSTGAMALVVARGCFFFCGPNLIPRIVLGIKLTPGFPDDEGQVKEFAHAVPQSHITTFTPRALSRVKCTHSRIVRDRVFGGIP